MDIIINPSPTEWPALAERNIPDDEHIAQSVRQIVETVQREGDNALYQ